MRSGVLARKVGMTRVWTDGGADVPVTVLEMADCQVVSLRTRGQDGYDAVQVGAGTRKAARATAALKGHCAKAGVAPKRTIAEFRVSPDNMLSVGDTITADHFVAGQYVDVAGVSIGKGFAGAMKRHNFGGLRASHGVSVSHRSHGSTGQCQDPGRVFKGKKMAGHMGARRVTVQNLEVVSSDPERGLLLVKGAVPGARAGWLKVSDACKRALPESAPAPGAVRARAEGGSAAAPAKDEGGSGE